MTHSFKSTSIPLTATTRFSDSSRLFHDRLYFGNRVSYLNYWLIKALLRSRNVNFHDKQLLRYTAAVREDVEV